MAEEVTLIELLSKHRIFDRVLVWVVSGCGSLVNDLFAGRVEVRIFL